MKKIFAIALALVMVLSMASAFAFCTVIDWSTTDACGMGSVEVVTYVQGNKVGGNTWTPSECAAAVNNQPVYFAVKVTVEANPNADWWTKARLTVSQSGLGTAGGAATTYVDFKNQSLNFGQAYPLFTNADDVVAGTYYLTYDGPVDSFDPATCLFSAAVADAATAKVCAELKFTASAKNQNAVEINGYSVMVVKNAGKLGTVDYDWYFNADNGAVGVYFKGKDMVGVSVRANNYYGYCDGKFIGNDGKTAEAACYNVNDYKAINGVFEALNISWISKISADQAIAKLSKTDKVSDCATWNSEALAIVNAECAVMSIPKTGDKSVLAWLF